MWTVVSEGPAQKPSVMVLDDQTFFTWREELVHDVNACENTWFTETGPQGVTFAMGTQEDHILFTVTWAYTQTPSHLVHESRMTHRQQVAVWASQPDLVKEMEQVQE